MTKGRGGGRDRWRAVQGVNCLVSTWKEAIKRKSKEEEKGGKTKGWKKGEKENDPLYVMLPDRCSPDSIDPETTT